MSGYAFSAAVVFLIELAIFVIAAAVGFLLGGFSGAVWAVVIVAAIGVVGGVVDLMRGEL